MAIRWLVLDAMGVVYKAGDDVAELLVPFVQSRNPSISLDDIREAYIAASFGKTTSAQFWHQVGLGYQYPDAEIEYLNSKLELTEGFVTTVENLSQSYQLAMLSNDVSEWSRHLRSKWHLDKYFDEYIISGDVGYRKPDDRIYSILLCSVKAAPNECIFIDDRPKNLAAAHRLGFKTCLFNTDVSDAGLCWDPTVTRFGELPAILDRW